MKRIATLMLLCAFAIFFNISAQVSSSSNLPTMTLMGKTFYYYESDKGESLAGIAKKFGWDPNILMKVNSDVITPLDKGTLLFYPAEGKSGNQAAGESKDAMATFPIEHTVARGETVYGIAKQYGLTQDDIFAANPDARQGIKAGETLVIKPIENEHLFTEVVEAENGSEELTHSQSSQSGIIYYTVENNEDLYTIARKFNTSVEDLFTLNPGIGPDDNLTGKTIKVSLNSKAADTHTEKVVESQLTGLASYKVHRGDTWKSIAQKNGISVELLKEANPGKGKLNRGDIIVIPDVNDVEVEKTYVEEDPRESTEAGRRELYNEVHSFGGAGKGTSGSFAGDLGEGINIAIVLDDTDSNKDMEFSRGAILAANNLRTRPFQTNLTIIDGNKPMEEIIGLLNDFSPSLIITTCDRSLPGYLKDYSRAKGVEIINAFDVKDEAYIENPYILQYLAPSSYFNDEISQYFAKNYNGSNVIIAGSMDSSDTLGEGIIKSIMTEDGSNVQEVDIAELTDMELLPDATYLIYGSASKKEDAINILEKVNVLRDRNPLATIKVIGRPSWITFADANKRIFGDNYVMMPTRFYFDAEETASRNFIEEYKEMYGHTPIKSYPVYSATAFDIINYFTPNIAATGGDFNATFTPQQTLQSLMDLQRVSNWGGIVNTGVYLIDFAPFGINKKIKLPSELDY